MSQAIPPGGFLDPDNWISWWQDLHRSPLIVGEVARFAIERLEAGDEGTGNGTLRFADSQLQEDFEVQIEYVIEQFGDHGRILFLLTLRSPGDPLPPLG
jgi:hypothetical protein